MLRRAFSRPLTGHTRQASTSFGVGLFKRELVRQSLFPFPTWKIEGDERDNMETLLSSINAATNPTPLQTWQDAGATALSIPSDFGGLGLSHTARATILETLAEGKHTGAVNAAQHQAICAHLIQSGGSAEHSGKFLTAMSSGKASFALAVSEPNNIADTSMCICRAVLDQATGIYELTGVKVIIGNWESAPSHLIVAAKVETQQKDEKSGDTILTQRTTLFAVEVNDKVVITSGVVDLKAASGFLIGVAGEGYHGLMVSVHTMRYGTDAAIVGACKALYDSSRTALPTDVAGFCAALIYGAQSTLFSVVSTMDNKAPDMLFDTTFASLTVNNSARKMIDAMERAWCAGSQRSSEAEERVAVLRTLLAQAESSHHLSNLISCCGVEEYGLSFQQESTFTTMGGRLARSFGSKERLQLKNSQPEIAQLEGHIAAFSDAVEAAFVTHAQNLKTKQLTSSRLAEAGFLIYSACATLSRASNAEKSSQEAKLLNAYLSYTVARLGLVLQELQTSSRLGEDSFVRIVGESLIRFAPIDPKVE